MTRFDAPNSPRLCPIPQNGLPKAAAAILYSLITLATLTVGIGISAMRTTSRVEVIIAEVISGIAMVLLCVHLWRVCRTVKGLVPLLVVIAVAFSYWCNSAIPAGVLISLLFAVGEGSVLLATLPKKQYPYIPLIPLGAYAVTALVSLDPLGAVAALVPFPAMLTLAWGTHRSAAREDGISRVGVICTTSAALVLSLGGMIVLSVYRQLGTLETSALVEAVDALRPKLIDLLTEALTQSLPENATEEATSFLSPESMENTVNSIINIALGVFVAFVNLLAAAAQLIQHAGLRAFGYGDSITDRVKLFRISLVSGIIFFVAYCVVMFSSRQESTLASAVAENLYIILLPGLALAGMLRVMAKLTARGKGGMGCLFYFLILVPCLLLFAPVVLALIEIIGHVVSTIADRLKPPDDDNPFGP